MRELVHRPATVSYLLELRDGAFAMDTLGQLAGTPERPDLSLAERELAGRNDPLCDMAVAIYGYDADAVQTVFDNARSPHHRIAVLGNAFVAATGWGGTVMTLEQASDVLSLADTDQLEALFSNARLTPEGLLDVLSRRGPAASMPDTAWPPILAGLASNPSVGDLFDARRVLSSAAVRAQMHVTLFALLRSLPPTRLFAEPLARFLTSLNDQRSLASRFFVEDIHDLILHWHPSVATDATGDTRFRVQMLLAMLGESDTESLAHHKFPSMQAAHMALAYIEDASDLDGMIAANAPAFFAGMPFNRELYDNPLIGTTFVAHASGRDESALAIYFNRRAMFDRLWRLDRPLVARDLERLRATLRHATPAPVLVPEKNLEKSMKDEAERRRIQSPGQTSQHGSLWRNLFYGAAIVIFLILAINLMFLLSKQ